MASLTLKRQSNSKALISLVPMIDVMLILLVFFMVTSTYLNLDMIPAVRQESDATETPNSGLSKSNAAPLLVRLGADGLPAVRGRVLSLAELQSLIRSNLADAPLTPIVVLPSGLADMQSLVSVMDVATQAGATRLRVIRLQGRP